MSERELTAEELTELERRLAAREVPGKVTDGSESYWKVRALICAAREREELLAENARLREHIERRASGHDPLASELRARAERAEAELKHYASRERQICAALGGVADGGQYLNDILAKIEKLKSR